MNDNQVIIEKWQKHWDQMGVNSSTLDQVNRDQESIEEDANYVQKILTIHKNDQIVDFCCGNGLITSKIAENCHSITGVDFSEKLIKSAKTHAENSSLSNCNFSKGDIKESKLPSNEFNKVYCLTSFHYFPDMDFVRDVIKEMLRILKPGGKILITDIPSKKHFGYFIWKIIRNPNPHKLVEMDELRPSESFLKRTKQRLKLLFRRFFNKKVESDDWTWFKPNDFQNLKMPQIEKLKIIPSNCPGKLLNYRFNLLINKTK